jgi:hypothetical protein
MATEPVPDAEENAVPFCTRVSPLADTLTLVPFSEELDDESVAEESELAGLAEAAHGAAASPIPIPSATASAPTRPIYLACPIVGFFSPFPCPSGHG